MKRIVNVSAVALVALLSAHGVVLAQAGADETQGTPAVSETETEQATSDTALPEAGTAEAGPPATVQEMVSEARATLASIEQASDNISRMLREARRDKDVVKVLCLDDKLNQINVARRSATDRMEGMDAAAAAGHKDRVEHDSAVMAALGERAAALTAEANQCIGEEQGIVGGASLDLVVDPDIPVEETADIPTLDLISAPPVAASPTF